MQKLRKMRQKQQIFTIFTNAGRLKNAGLAPKKTGENTFSNHFE